MRKKFLAMYALAGALVASPVFTSCVDDSVSDSVEALRGAKVEALKAQAAYDNALAQAALINANANAAYYNAQAELNKAKAAVEAAAAKAQELANQIAEGRLEADLAAALAAAEQAKLEAEQALAIAKINAEKALEMAKWEAQQALWSAEQLHAQQQANYENFFAGLATDEKLQAEKINSNVNAILKGGDYYGLNTYGGWYHIRNYAKKYSKDNTYTSINGLIAGLATEKVALIGLENGLVDLAEYIAGQKEKNDETIATNKALIEKYTALMESSSRESLEKEYKAAKEAQAEISALLKENAVALYKAGVAKTEFGYKEELDPIYKLIDDNCEYLTAKKAEEYKATYKNVAGDVTDYLGNYSKVYEHTADDATELATDIETLEGKIKTLEGNIEVKEAEIAAKEDLIAAKEAETENAEYTELERNIAIKQDAYDKEEDAYNAILASQAYLDYMKAFEDAVTAAETAFNTTPTAETKKALEEAEAKLAAADYEYETGKKLSEYKATVDAMKEELDEMNAQLTAMSNAQSETLDDLKEELNDLKEELADLQDYEPTSPTGEPGLKQLNAKLEELKGLQTILAADSKEMTAYLALCKEYAALEKAWFEVDVVNDELEANASYYEKLMESLEAYVGEKTNENKETLLPDYAALIEGCEQTIKETERANEALVYGDNNDKLTGVDGENEAAQEKLIADKKAEIAAMEAELETRQAEYKAEVAALNALLGTAEEE